MSSESYDVIIIGAGLSGIDAAYRVKTELPDCKWTVLEGRKIIGGTWSFFKFPGLRSDSNLNTFGYPWRRWDGDRDIATADEIMNYLQGAIEDEGLDQYIKYNHYVKGADWSTPDQQWSLDVEVQGVKKEFRATFVIGASGFYDYKQPLQTSIPGLEKFTGTVVHPQFWPEDLDYAGKKVALIGSGATATTIMPAMVEKVGHMTMIQRSPTYFIYVPRVDPMGKFIRDWLPKAIGGPLDWWRSLMLEVMWYNFNMWFPATTRKMILALTKWQLPESVPIEPHFDPSYRVFEQRYGYTPDGEFFKALYNDNCELVTDTIKTMSGNKIILASGQEVEADIVITATGLQVRVFGSLVPTVDGKPIDVGSTYLWKGTMLSGVPNIGSVIGSTTNTWTLAADVCVRNLIQVYKHMKRTGSTSAVPVYDGMVPVDRAEPMINFVSTYFQRAYHIMPRVTGEGPWARRVHALWDRLDLIFGNVTRGIKYTRGKGDKDQ